MNRFKLINANSIPDASRLIRRRPAGEAVLMAGGTDLLVLRRHGLVRPAVVIRVAGDPWLCECRPVKDGGISIGAFVTLDELARHPLVREKYPMLSRAARAVASPQIRHKATVGGNVCLNTRCWYFNRSAFWRKAYPDCRKAAGGNTCYVMPDSRKGCFALQSGDIAGPLVALNAQMCILSESGERRVDAGDFYRGDGIDNIDLEHGEILSAILLPPPRAGGVFVKFRPQNNMDFATFTLSVLAGGDDGGPRIVVGSVASRPLRAKKAEEMLDTGQADAGAVAAQAAKELPMVSFVRGSVAFKRQAIAARLTQVLVSSPAESRGYQER